MIVSVPAPPSIFVGAHEANDGIITVTGIDRVEPGASGNDIRKVGAGDGEAVGLLMQIDVHACCAMRLAFEPAGQGIEMHLLQIVGAAGSSGKSEIGILRAAQIIGDDILVELSQPAGRRTNSSRYGPSRSN